MEDKEKKSPPVLQIGFVDILFFVFLILKLCGVIDWPWVWVLAPLWIPLVLVVLLFIVLGIIYLYFRVKGR